MSNKALLISGVSGSGKSASLRNIKHPAGVMYLNCESGKDLPFNSGFDEYTVTDPLQVPDAFTHAETLPECHTVIVDGSNFLMDMYESLYIIGATNTMQGWSAYAQFFKNLLQQQVALSTKNVIFTAHTLATLNEADMVMEVKVPIKGALKNSGIEAFFSNVISTKKKTLVDLANFKSDLLNIDAEEEMVGFKHCFQTRITKETVNERIRAPLGMWTQQESFIDNDIQEVLDKLHLYYT